MKIGGRYSSGRRRWNGSAVRGGVIKIQGGETGASIADESNWGSLLFVEGDLFILRSYHEYLLVIKPIEDSSLEFTTIIIYLFHFTEGEVWIEFVFVRSITVFFLFFDWLFFLGGWINYN